MKALLVALLKLLLGFIILIVGFFGGFILGASYWEHLYASALVGHPHMARCGTGEIPFGFAGGLVGLCAAIALLAVAASVRNRLAVSCNGDL